MLNGFKNNNRRVKAPLTVVVVVVNVDSSHAVSVALPEQHVEEHRAKHLAPRAVSILHHNLSLNFVRLIVHHQ